MEHLKDATLETLSNAWEQAWTSYSAVVKQVQDYGHSSIEKAQIEYDAAKTNLSERTKDIRDWVAQNGEKLQDNASELQADTYEKLGTARKEAYEKYLQSKEGLKGLFSQAHQEANRDVETAETQIKKASARLEKHLATSSEENKEEWEKTKAKLESAKQRAQSELDEAKAHAETLGARVSGWSQDVIKTLGDESEFLTQRAKDLGEKISHFASESKEKVEESSAFNTIQDKWNVVYKVAQEEATYAQEIWTKAQETLADFWQSAKAAVGLDATPDLLKTPEPKEHHTAETTQKSAPNAEQTEEVVIPEGSGVLLN